MLKKNYHEERIFIAGAKGMVGSSIKKTLINKGYGNKNLEKTLLCPSKAELDLLNFEDLNNWFKKNKPTTVIISAAKVGGIFANSNQPYDFIIENLKIQTNLIEISYIHGVKKLLFLGSSCIYPKFAPQPIKEEYLLTDYLEETNEFYAIAKIAGIKLCQALNIQHNFNSICLMPTNLYGPGDNYHPLNSHVMPSLIRKFHEGKENNSKEIICWGTGLPLREFLYVDDLSKACLFILENWEFVLKNISLESKKKHLNWLNIGSKYEISIKELVEKISNIVGYKGEIIWDKQMPNGTPRKKLDTTKINKLGWEASTNLDEGIKLTLEDFKQRVI